MNFALVFHNHQPVGQLPWAFDDACDHSYAPVLAALEKHPNVRAAIHNTGPLLEWMGARRPELLAQMRALVARGQIEILTGGEAEPILAIWPPDDNRAQIRKLSSRAEELFGVTPRGLWLAERVWEPQLGAQLLSAGASYTFVDGGVFEAAGVPERESFGSFQDESGLRVLPINKTLRDLIPWREPNETLDFLRQARDVAGSDALCVFADDGEKFGAWPGTYGWVFEQGWLERFFVALENASWLQTVLPGDYVSSHEAKREVALPPGSYPEMQAWSGGNWRNFLERYPESRDLFDEAMRVRPLVLENETAYAHLLRAQCNDAFWHGTFGGLYLRHLRQAVYAQTSRAQREVEGDAPFVRAEVENDVATLQNERQLLRFRAQGGQLFNWTSKLRAHNLLATLRRHRERYHAPDAAQDWYARGALIDHFLGDAATPERWQRAAFPEQGDFASEAWQLQTRDATVLLHRRGGVWSNGEFVPVTVEKRVALTPESDELRVEYRITNESETLREVWWACEWNLALTSSELPDRHYHPAPRTPREELERIATFENVTNPMVADNWLGLQVEFAFDDAVSMWHAPIYTESEREGGQIERTYQQSAWLFHRRLTLLPREAQGIAFSITLTPSAE